jgi:hypothetical protein
VVTALGELVCELDEPEPALDEVEPSLDEVEPSLDEVEPLLDEPVSAPVQGLVADVVVVCAAPADDPEDAVDVCDASAGSWPAIISPAITAQVPTNSVTAPVATRRRIVRVRLCRACFMDCACSFMVRRASRSTVATPLGADKKVL